MMKRKEEVPSYSILMAIRAAQKGDRFYGQQGNLKAGRQHAKTASQVRQDALRGLRKMEAIA